MHSALIFANPRLTFSSGYCTMLRDGSSSWTEPSSHPSHALKRWHSGWINHIIPVLREVQIKHNAFSCHSQKVASQPLCDTQSKHRVFCIPIWMTYKNRSILSVHLDLQFKTLLRYHGQLFSSADVLQCGLQSRWLKREVSAWAGKKDLFKITRGWQATLSSSSWCYRYFSKVWCKYKCKVWWYKYVCMKNTKYDYRDWSVKSYPLKRVVYPFLWSTGIKMRNNFRNSTALLYLICNAYEQVMNALCRYHSN